MATLLGRRTSERLIFTERRCWRSRRTLQILQATLLLAGGITVYWALQATELLQVIDGLLQALRSVLAHSSHRFIGGPAATADPA